MTFCECLSRLIEVIKLETGVLKNSIFHEMANAVSFSGIKLLAQDILILFLFESSQIIS